MTIETREALQEKIANLRQRRGMARLDGDVFDATAIASAEAELEAIDDAEAVAVARQREAEAKAQAALREALQMRKDVEVERYLSLVSSAHVHFDKAGVAMAEAVRAGIGLGKLEHQLTGESIPTLFEHGDLTSRLSRRLAALMRFHFKDKFGGIWWQGGAFLPPQHDWTAEEAVELTKHLNYKPKGTQNGKG